MLVTEAIQLAKQIYSHMDERNFVRKVGPKSYQEWCAKGKNIITILKSFSPEFRDKFWKWLLTLGVENLDQIHRMYSIISVVYEKRADFPHVIKNLIGNYDNFAVFLGILGDKLIKVMCDWAETNLTENEKILAQGSYIINFSAPRQAVVNRKTLPRVPIRKNVAQIRVNAQIDIKVVNKSRPNPPPPQLKMGTQQAPQVRSRPNPPQVRMAQPRSGQVRINQRSAPSVGSENVRTMEMLRQKFGQH